MMAFEPAQRLQDIPEYVFARLGKEVKAVEAKTGRKVLDLGIGTPDVDPSEMYREKFAELVREPNAHRYPGYGATPEFAQAIINWHQQRYGVQLEPNELQPLNGAKDGIAHLPQALLNAGDEILVPNPGYPSFSTPALLAGATVVSYDLLESNDFKLDLAAIKTKLSDRTKYMWVNFPSNPTGQVATLDELRALVDFARENSIYILYDAAYSEITFDDFIAPSILQIEGAKDVAVEFGSFSKSFSFAGYRMGWVVGNADIVAAIHKLKTQLDSGMPLQLQGLGAFALNNPDEEWSKVMLKSYKERRDIISDYVRQLGLEFELPQGSLYIWAKIPEAAKDSESFCLELLHDRQILVGPGSAYGTNGDRYVRVSICANIDHIAEYFE